MPLTVKLNAQRLSLPRPPLDTTLAQFRQILADLTHLAPNAFKLIHAGAVMKDDAAPLSAYRITPNATIVLISHPENPLPGPPPPPISSSSPSATASSENVALALIHAELSAVRSTLTPDVQAFLDALSSLSLPVSKQPPSLPTHRDHSRLGELLLQSLLRLDAIAHERDWPSARAARKAAVKEVQSLLDSLDSAWSDFSSSRQP